MGDLDGTVAKEDNYNGPNEKLLDQKESVKCGYSRIQFLLKGQQRVTFCFLMVQPPPGQLKGPALYVKDDTEQTND